MKSNLKISFIVALLFLAVTISGCSSPLSIKYIPLENPDNHLASIPPVKIKLLPILDKRTAAAEETLVGEIKTGARVGREDVKSEKSVLDILHETIKSELSRNGHVMVDENEAVAVKVELKHFWLKTDVNSELGHEVDDWDVIAEIKIQMEVEDISSGKSAIFGPYYAKNSEKRYLMPDKKSMERIIEGSLSKLMKKMNSDTELASALKK